MVHCRSRHRHFSRARVGALLTAREWTSPPWQITSIVEFILAARVEHGYGVLAALISYSLALSGLIAILNSNFFAKFKRWWRLFVWLPNISLFCYLIILLSVRWAAPDHPVTAFPSACRFTANCCRLTPVNATSTVTLYESPDVLRRCSR